VKETALRLDLPALPVHDTAGARRSGTLCPQRLRAFFCGATRHESA
jgi:hypothetical protein